VVKKGLDDTKKVKEFKDNVLKDKFVENVKYFDLKLY